MSTQPQPIPWAFSELPGIRRWTWLSEHAVCIVDTELVDATGAAPGSALVDGPGARQASRSHTWSVADRIRTNQGVPRVLVEGQAATFDQAEDAIREHIGKLYDPSLGYGAFAGRLAGTFTLASGERVDLTDFIGRQCAVTVRVGEHATRGLVGELTIHHYRVRLRSAGGVTEITPEHIVSIHSRAVPAAGQSANGLTAAVRPIL